MRSQGQTQAKAGALAAQRTAQVARRNAYGSVWRWCDCARRSCAVVWFGVAILANCSFINDKRFPQIGKRPVLGNLCIKKYQNFKQASNGQANE